MSEIERQRAVVAPSAALRKAMELVGEGGSANAVMYGSPGLGKSHPGWFPDLPAAPESLPGSAREEAGDE